KRLLIRSTYGTYKPEIYRYYSSATQSETGMVGDESAADGRTNIWRSGALWASLGGGILAGIAGLYFLVGFFFTSSAPAADDVAGLSSEQLAAMESQAHIAGRTRRVDPEPLAVTAPSVPPTPTQPAQPALSASWRIGGYIGRAVDIGGSSGSASVPDVMPGYPDESLGATHSVQDRAPLAILVGHFGAIRYAVLTECTPYPDGIHWYCDIDGERVTP